MSSPPLDVTRVILPMHCEACRRLVRLEIRDPTQTTVKRVWICQDCGAKNAVRARWQIVKVLDLSQESQGV